MPSEYDSKERGAQEIHMKCAKAQIFKTDAHKVMAEEYAQCFKVWT